MGIPGQTPVSPEAQNFFNMVDKDRSGKIDAEDLQQALVNGNGENFSITACNMMINMFNKDKTGCVDVYEFEKLFNYINQWIAAFKAYDRDQSGAIDEAELAQALVQMGYRLSPEFIKSIIARSDPVDHEAISMDQFIVLCVQIQRFSDAFRVRDTEQRGFITIGFEDFLNVAWTMSE
jgi:Ca2+-binding EF-hand superfamily protein